jgi:molecular chaperone DnaJ
MIEHNYYMILGVSRKESDRGIRDAFRRLVKQYHPDIVGPGGTKRYRDIVEAYGVLSDPDKRASYNHGLDHVEQARTDCSKAGDPNPLYTPPSFFSEPISVFRDFQTFTGSFDALFERLARNFTRGNAEKAERPENLSVEIILTPEEAWRGGRLPLSIPAVSSCSHCDGTGMVQPFFCRYCQGRGTIELERTVFVHIPPRLKQDMAIDVPLQGLGIRNLHLKALIRIGSRNSV